MAGETKDGKLCNVCVVQPMFVVCVWKATMTRLICDYSLSVVVMDHFALKIVAIY
jgi:hypothetical protein